MTTDSLIIERSQQVILSNYGRLPLCIDRAEGSYFWDSRGKRFLDFFAGFGACGISGHCHPSVTQALQQQAQTLCAHGNLFTNKVQIQVAEQLVEHSFPGQVFFCHSGAEANEAALKLARKRSADAQIVITFESCFHGRTYGSLSLCPEVFQEGFGSMLPNVVRLPFGDSKALQDAFSDSIAAVFIEPIQGEGGVNVPEISFMQELRSLCSKHDALFVSDEVWTAPGRTGKWFAYQHFDVEPDIICMGKALGSGAPVGAILVAQKFTDVLGPGSHGCTMGGNPLCMSAALAGLQLLENENLTAKAEQNGGEFKTSLEKLFGNHAEAVRGKGLFLGVQLREPLDAGTIMKLCLNEGLYVGTAKNNVLRFAPALTTPHECYEEAIQILNRVIEKCS